MLIKVRGNPEIRKELYESIKQKMQVDRVKIIDNSSYNIYHDYVLHAQKDEKILDYVGYFNKETKEIRYVIVMYDETFLSYYVREIYLNKCKDEFEPLKSGEQDPEGEVDEEDNDE